MVYDAEILSLISPVKKRMILCLNRSKGLINPKVQPALTVFT